MLLWLNGTSNNRWDVNENYARELQELFCLGAGRGYSERDVRQLARALTGFRNDWTDAGPTRFRFDKEFHDRGAKRSTAVAASTAGRRRCGWSRAIAATPSSWSRSCGATSSRPSRRRRRRRRWRGCTSPRTATSARCSRRSSPTPTSTTPPSAWSSRRSCRSPGCCAPSGAGSTRPRGRGCATRAGQYLFHAAERLRLGRHALAGHGDVPRPLADRPAHLRPGQARRREGRHVRQSDPAELVNRAAAFWGSPTLSAPVRAGPRALRRRHAGRRRQALEGLELPRARARTRCGCSSPPPRTT